MADVTIKGDTALTNVIDDGVALTNGDTAAGDYDNTVGDIWCHAYLTVQYDAGPPTAGALVANLFVILADQSDQTDAIIAEGGDATLGTDVVPQASLQVGAFETRSPSTSVDEVLMIPWIRLTPGINRFVIENTSGQTFDLTWQLDIKPLKYQVV